ncbi:Microtubule-associated protein, microtubule dynamics during spindle orientation [Boothiomyces macroporosus]|uniref:Microtubule-associated protein, microtubule dynamics during spindle orientation n=1 Tax=Boothiomyces macroporosus TaxID=261099 RepID=A0AAD5UCY7_9FUNG|nr:Microtubule-associated protein, microtubule dynamics during spindle orientation [Boothiomyces macroporosus]
MPTAEWNGKILASTTKFEKVEGNIYFPIESVDMQYFKPSSTHSTCPWKGIASYYTLSVDGKENVDAAWYYPSPKPAADNIKGYVAFWKGVKFNKSWKARVSGYEEIQKLLKQGETVDSGFILKAISDSNQIALEQGILATLEYSRIATLSQKQLNQVVICLASTRQTTKQSAQEILMLNIEKSDPILVLEILVETFSHKTPKNVASAVNCLALIINNFGIPSIQVKPVLAKLSFLFDHKDKNVRAEATGLTVEIFKWIKNAIMPSLQELKPVQLKDLEALFEQNRDQVGVKQRYLPNEKPKPVSGSVKDAEVEEPVEQAVPDAFDFADPVAFIDKIPKSFYADIQSTKWKERKEALELLLGLLSFPKLEDGRYHELVNILSKKLADPNVVVLILASNCLEKMASGLRGSFKEYRNIVVAPTLDRLKEKKTNIIESLRALLDSTFRSINKISDILEDVLAGMNHSNPGVKNESIQWLIRCMTSKTKTDLAKPELKQLIEKLLKLMDDSSADIRDSAAQCLGVMMKVYGDKAVVPFLDRLDKVKMQKVTDHYEKSKGANSKPAEKKALPIQKAPSPKAMPPRQSNPSTTSISPVSSPKPVKTLKKKAVGSSSVSTLGSKSNSVSSLPEEVKYRYSDDSAIEYIESTFQDEAFTQIGDSSWKIRLEGIHKLLEIFKDTEFDTEALIRYLLKKLTWKESNFQVMIGMVNIFTLTTTKASFDKGSGLLLVSGLVEKLGDMKIKKLAGNCLDEISAKISLNAVLDEAYPTIKQMKAPKIIADTLLWINQSIKEFGTAGLSVKNLVGLCKEMLNSPSAPVKTQALGILATLRQFVGPTIRDLLVDLPPNVLSNIDAEFQKVEKLAAPVPTRVQETKPLVKEVLVTKSDLNVSQDLLNKMNDSNWKERKEGMEEFAKVLSMTSALTPNLSSEVVNTLKARLNDNNKIISTFSVEICTTLIKLIGKGFDKYIKILIAPILAQLSDQKQQIRDKVILLLDQTNSLIGIGSVLINISQSLQQDQPQIRKDLLKWLVDNNGALKNEQDTISLVQPLLACLQDRNAEVRKLAQTVITNISEFVDIAYIRQKAGDLYRGAQLATITPVLDALGGSNESISSKPSTTSSAKSVPEKKKVVAKSTKPVSVPKKEPVVEVLNDGNLLTGGDLKQKEQRASMDRGVYKWAFESPRKDLQDLLADQFQPNVTPELYALLFSTDHYKEKDYLSALKMLDGYITDPQTDKQILIDRCVANCDLVLKYATIRFFDTNTSIFIKCLDLLEHFLLILDEAGYYFNEYEASSFLPFFINKMGDPKETMRVKLRAIMKQIGRLYPVSKLLVYLLKGLDSKNSRTRTECLDEVAYLIQRNGSSVFVPSKTIPVIALQVADRDASVRNAALNAICQAYSGLGDDLFKHLQKISDKDRDMINEKIKRMGQRPTSAGVPGVLPSPQGSPLISRKIPVPSRSPTPVNNHVQLEEKSPLTANMPITVKKEFSLDIDEIFESKPAPPVQPKPSRLEQLENLEDRLEVRLELVTTQLFSSDNEVVLEAVRHLEKLINANSNSDIIHSRNLVGLITPLMNNSFANLGTENVVSRICKHFISALISIFSSKEQAVFVEYDALEGCIRSVLIRLVDPALNSFDPSKTLSRALNMLMVRIIENCPPNVTFRALLQILKEASLEPEPFDEATAIVQKKYTELVMKCLWKITKVLSTFIEAGQLQVDSLLLDIHLFLSAASPQFWKAKVAEGKSSQPDMPLRTVKTIMHELVNIMGDNVLLHTSAIPSNTQNHVYNYLTQMISNLNKKKNGESPGKLASPKSYRGPTDTELVNLLDEIFKQISDKESSKAGLRRLSDLQKQHPNVLPLLEVRLSKEGSFLQSYIRRGLAAISQEEVAKNTGKLASFAKPTADTTATVYDQKLQTLQKMFKSNQISNITTPSFSTATSTASLTGIPVNSERDVQREKAVMDLKERLAKMKKLASNSTENLDQ